MEGKDWNDASLDSNSYLCYGGDNNMGKSMLENNSLGNNTMANNTMCSNAMGSGESDVFRHLRGRREGDGHVAVSRGMGFSARLGEVLGSP